MFNNAIKAKCLTINKKEIIFRFNEDIFVLLVMLNSINIIKTFFDFLIISLLNVNKFIESYFFIIYFI